MTCCICFKMKCAQHFVCIGMVIANIQLYDNHKIIHKRGWKRMNLWAMGSQVAAVGRNQRSCMPGRCIRDFAGGGGRPRCGRGARELGWRWDPAGAAQARGTARCGSLLGGGIWPRGSGGGGVRGSCAETRARGGVRGQDVLFLVRVCLNR